jgi:hypothetical protein
MATEVTLRAAETELEEKLMRHERYLRRFLEHLWI